MARRAGSKNELVKCEYCGEMYSVTYKRCPFCNGDGTGRWDDLTTEQEEYEPKGGKRLVGGGSQGGGRGPSIRQIIGLVVSLALIIAAVCIVISLVKPLLGGKKTPTPTASPSAAVSAEPTQSAPPEPTPTASEPTEPPVDPVNSAAPAASQPPAPQVSTPSVSLTAPTSFKLNREDFTFDHVGEVFQLKATYTPADARGDITWKSSDPNVASVAWDGTVTAVSKGTVTVTATVAGVGEKECIVRCNFKADTSSAATPAPAASAAPQTSSAPSSSSGLSLNREDFTLSHAGETWRLVVSGSGSAVTWASTKPEVATVGGDGTVTAVSAGTCKVTATVDGVTLECIVRCSF